MRHFFSHYVPYFRRVLVVESGSRHLLEELLPGIYDSHPTTLERVDLVTCYPGAPRGFDATRGEIHRVTDYSGRRGRKALYRLLRAKGYDIQGIVCSGEPIMTKWKWALALRVPAKLFVLNENCDYFWFDLTEWRTIKRFALYRAGLSGAEGVATLARLALFPFTFTFLLLFAAYVHARRYLRT